MKIFKQILLCVLMVSFAACSSDDDATGTDDSSGTPEEPSGTAKVKEFKMRDEVNNSSSDWNETATVYDYDAEGRISEILYKYTFSNPSENYQHQFNVNYNSEGKVDNLNFQYSDTGESGTINFNYSSDKLSSISGLGDDLPFTYHSGNNSFTYQLDAELDVDTIYFNSSNDIVRHASSFYGTSQLTTNSNSGVYAGTSINPELKIFLTMRAGGLANCDYYQSKEVTRMVISGQIVLGPIEEPYVFDVVNVERNADGLIESYAYSDDFQNDLTFEITYTN